jgi:Ca-activated chloride channel family protein
MEASMSADPTSLDHLFDIVTPPPVPSWPPAPGWFVMAGTAVVVVSVGVWHAWQYWRPGIRTALVADAGNAHLVMPLTRDADLITRFAAELSPTIMPVTGDVAGEALALSQEQLRKSGLRGSLLLITNGVSAEQLPQLAAYHKNVGAPVQILAVAASSGVPVPPNSPPAPALDRAALNKAAETLDATLTTVSPNDSDVRWLARHTATSLVAVSAEQTGERWKDAGYWLVFSVAALALMWFRPGWLVQWS